MKTEEGRGDREMRKRGDRETRETRRRARYLSPRLHVSTSPRLYIILHPFNRLFRQQLKLQRGGCVLVEEVVDIGREIDDGEVETVSGEQFAVARGGAASGGVGVERGDDPESSERREPVLFKSPCADEADGIEAVREERERVCEALDEIDDRIAHEVCERVNVVESGD